MRIVFFGTPTLAVPTLAAIHKHHDVLAAVCQPDRPQGRSKRPVPSPVKVWAEANGVLVHQPAKLNDGAFEHWFREQAPEGAVVAAYGRLLKQPILDVPSMGWLNVHPSLLPKYRGPSPIQSAILNGETETGVSIMQVILEMDAGDLLIQEPVAIDPDETAGELTDRLAHAGADLMVKGLAQLADGTAVFKPQDPEAVTVTKLFEKADGRIRWGATAREIHNLVRAAAPWPTAHCHFRGEVCRIHKTAVLDTATGAAPGTVTAIEKDAVHVAAGAGQIAVKVFQAPGKRAMAMDDYLRGHAIAVGEGFEDIS